MHLFEEWDPARNSREGCAPVTPPAMSLSGGHLTILGLSGLVLGLVIVGGRMLTRFLRRGVEELPPDGEAPPR